MAGYSDKHFGGDGSVTHHRHAGLFQSFKIVFSHGAGGSVDFPAILQSFTDNFQSNWNKEDYYGRMDQVAKFKNTTRQISFEIIVVSDEASDAATNLHKFQKLSRFLYPVYRSSPDPAVNGTGNATLISSAPIIGIEMGNLIQNRSSTGGPLMGYVDGFEFRPDNEATWFLADGMDNTDRRGIKNFFNDKPEVQPWAEATNSVEGAIYLPSRFTLNVVFNVLHQHALGWSENAEWLGEDFPYRMQALGEAIPDDIKEKAIIQNTAKIGPKATITKVVKQGLLGKLFFGPDGT